MKLSLLLLLSVLSFGCMSSQKKPNILWIVVEDMSSHFVYNGETAVKTPNVDKLAGEGVVFTNAYVTAPVCSTSRSAMITGMYQTAIGAHHHRSSRGTEKIQLPKKIRLIPELFKDAGYWTSNMAINKKKGKTDYNFEFDDKLYDGIDWAGRMPGQPFFAQVQLGGGKKRKTWQRDAKHINPLKPEDVSFPPYYPDIPEVRKDWADYLNCVQVTDYEVGIIIDRLKKEGELENTVIIFMTDHGVSHARGKQFMYDEGAKIPFIVHCPKRFSPEVRDELMVHIDMAATSLDLAGIDIPDYMQARPLFGSEAEPREYVISARDRCDETVDHMRSVRKGNFKYIRNYLPERPYLQPCAYKDAKPWMSALKKMSKEGKLNQIQALHFAKKRPKEELYELTKDRWEVVNLAGKPEFKNKLAEMREILKKWEVESNDMGRQPESEKMFNCDMKLYVDHIRKRMPDRAKIIEDNIALMRKWKAEGK